MTRRSHQRATVISACLCMLAVALLYAPLAAAVWAAQTMACCTGDHCPVAAHHHHKAPAEPVHEMDCGHEMGSLMSCTMSCCEITDRPLVTSLAFPLPDLSLAGVTLSSSKFSETLQAVEGPICIEPLSPPPRLRSAAL
jgi:hypothetical protein